MGVSAKRSLVCLTLCMLLLSFSAGCMSSQTSKRTPESNSDPINLTVYQTSANISDEEFQRLVVEPVHKKFPNVTLNLIHETRDASPDKLVAAGTLPDMIFGSLDSIHTFSDLDAVIDLTGLLRKFRIDINKFDPTSVSAIQLRSPRGEILAVPFSINFSVLYYNKDLFDKFGVSYPKDGMTWGETINLAKKLTSNSNEVQGITIDGGIDRLGGQLSLSFVDPATNKATLATDGWKQVYEVDKMIYDISGIASPNPRNAFMKDHTAAMMVSQGARIGEFGQMYNQGDMFKWDIATIPSFQDAPGKGFGPDIHLLMISSQSKHKEEAFQVLSLLTSEEAQQEMSKGGRLSSLKDAKSMTSFGQNLKSLHGVNIKPILDYTAIPEQVYSKYSSFARKQIAPAMNKALSGETDINSALRQAEELANQAIASTMAQEGK